MMPIRSVRDLRVALRAARKALGLTQADLAMAAGVRLQFVVELEAGKPTVRLERVPRVVDALGRRLELRGLATGAPRVNRVGAWVFELHLSIRTVY